MMFIDGVYPKVFWTAADVVRKGRLAGLRSRHPLPLRTRGLSHPHSISAKVLPLPHGVTLRQGEHIFTVSARCCPCNTLFHSILSQQ